MQGIQKIKDFMRISKMQICLNDKILPTNLNLKPVFKGKYFLALFKYRFVRAFCHQDN